MFYCILGEAADDEFLIQDFTFKLSFFFRFSTWKWLFSWSNHATITIRGWFEIILVSNMLYIKSAILGLSFLDLRIFAYRYECEHFLTSIFCKVSLALLNRIQPILERLNENITKPWKPSIIHRSNKCC